MTILCSMKKAISVLVIAAFVLCGESVMAVAVPSDVDGNGVVSTADARLVLLGILDETRLTEAQRLSADLDGDGRLTSADARSLLLEALGTENAPVVTSTTAATTTVTLPDLTTVNSTTFTMPETTTTSGWDCISTTTVTTTEPSTTVTYPPTTLPYGEPVVFTLSTDEEYVRAGRTFDLHVDISKNHSVVGYQMAIYYNPEEVTPQRVNEDESNPYAHGLNAAIYDNQAQWSFTLERDGLLKASFVCAAQTGQVDEARLFSLTFFLDELAEQYTDIHLYAWPVLCSVGGFEYEPSVHVNGGVVKIASSTTRPKTTTEGTTDPTWPTTTVTVWEDGTTTTVPDCVSTPAPTTTETTTTTTTWVLTGPDGTAPTTMPTTTQTTYVWTTTTYPPTTTT